MSRGKVVELHEALGDLVRAGDHVHLAYNEARPNAAILGLARRFRGERPALTVSTLGLVSSQACLVSEGLVAKLIASFVGDNYPAGGPNPLFQRAIDAGELQLEEGTLWTVVARLAAGALGVPWLPVNSLRGSDLAHQDWVLDVAGADGECVTAVSALQPDVTIVHGVAADAAGNVLLSPPYGELVWGALAAKRGVIATVEAIVDDETVRTNQSLVGIPSHVVRAVCHVPFGAHPYGLSSPLPEVPGYVEDEEFILGQRKTTREPDAQAAWVAEWVHGCDHAGYLAKVGLRRLEQLVGAAAPGVWSTVPDHLDETSPVTAEERMVLQAATVIEQTVRATGSEVLMTGIGFANLAAWVADAALRGSGDDVPLMAEIGAYGYRPRPGDPFIFSHRNLPTCTWMTGVTEILGSIMGGTGGRSLAVLGAGQIDARGATNSSRSGDGGFLVGSGGANDIASGADEVIVVLKHGRSRLVDEVPFVTCPGGRVSTIVTTEVVLRRRRADDVFEIVSVLADDGDLDVAVKQARDGIGWDAPAAAEVTRFDPVDEDALRRLRAFDPRHHFLPDPARMR